MTLEEALIVGLSCGGRVQEIIELKYLGIRKATKSFTECDNRAARNENPGLTRDIVAKSTRNPECYSIIFYSKHVLEVFRTVSAFDYFEQTANARQVTDPGELGTRA